MRKARVLIVEDTPSFQQIYSRAVERLGGESVVAASYETAVQMIREMLFDAALVDVRLSESDEGNVDGLRVLEHIQESGDPTRSILITGYGTFQIARESITTYGAFRSLEKSEISPGSLAGALREACEAFRNEWMKKVINYSHILKPPSVSTWEWEHQVLLACGPKGGASGLYMFFEAFFRELVPLIPYSKVRGCIPEVERKLVTGLFWSKAVGKALFISFGAEAAVEPLRGMDAKALTDLPPGLPRVDIGREVKKAESQNVCGVARLIDGHEFALYG